MRYALIFLLGRDALRAYLTQPTSALRAKSLDLRPPACCWHWWVVGRFLPFRIERGDVPRNAFPEVLQEARAWYRACYRPSRSNRSRIRIQAKTPGMNQGVPLYIGIAAGGRKSSAERPASASIICSAAILPAHGAHTTPEPQ